MFFSHFSQKTPTIEGMDTKDMFRAALNLSSQKEVYIRVRIVSNAQKTEVKELMSDGETWKICVAAQAEKGKANAELVKFLRKKYKVSATIISGKTERTKLIKIIC